MAQLFFLAEAQGACRAGAAARRWLDYDDANCSSGAEEGREDTSAARLLTPEELAPGMRVVKALTRQDLHTGQARP
jgi:hypothetical protein